MTTKDETLALAGEPVGYLRTTEIAMVFMPLRPVKDGECFYTADQVLAARKPLEEEVERLKQEKEYRYVEQVLSPIRRLLKVAECAENMANNFSEEIEGDDGRGVFCHQHAFDELSDALDLLDELPDDKPGYVLGGAAKAAWALHDIIGDTNV